MAQRPASLEALAPLGRELARALADGADATGILVPGGLRGARWEQAVGQALGGSPAGGPRAGVAALHAAYAWLVRLVAARVLADLGGVAPGRLAQAPARDMWRWLEALAAGELGASVAVEGLWVPDDAAWAIAPPCRTPRAEGAWRELLRALASWQPRSDRDVFQGLYQAMLPAALRHALGEFYTPRWLVQAVLAEAPTAPGWSALDPCCGSGAFLTELAARVLAETASEPPQARVEAVLRRVRGLDVNPLAVLAARVNLLLAIAPLLPGCGGARLRLPVDLLDAGAEETGSWQHDVVVGNPPWVAWRDLPAPHRDALAALRLARGLAGSDRWVGGTDLNVCVVLAHVAMERWVRPGGTLAFLMPRQLLHLRAAEGFRRWELPGGERVALTALTDWTALRPFEAACAPMTWVLTRAPVAGPESVPTVTWTSPGRGRRDADASWGEVQPTLVAGVGCATQRGGPGGGYVLEGPPTHAPLATYLGPTPYQGRRATETSPHGVFWLRPVGPAPGEEAAWLVETGVNPRARLAVPAQRVVLEREVLVPLLRGRDIRPFAAEPGGTLLLFPHAAAHAERALPPEALPGAARAYLERHRALLSERASLRAYCRGGPFYTLWRVGPYTFAPWKVVWPELGALRAAVVGEARLPWGESKGVVPEGKVNFIGCDDPAEAHYLCALLNASPLREAYAACTSALGRPARLPLAIPAHDARRWTHRALAAVSLAAHAGRVSPEACGPVLAWLAARAIARPGR
ncbi:MAG: N-6 DNA methylase [Candidatus Sericytochromatia bacterium]|nr:N-6 DNA methylase [Candidatus Sericytochromatia bacterium]